MGLLAYQIVLPPDICNIISPGKNQDRQEGVIIAILTLRSSIVGTLLAG